MKSINYPCVIMERPKGYITTKDLSNFAICRSQEDIDRLKPSFKQPVLCHYYDVVNNAIQIDNLLNKTL